MLQHRPLLGRERRRRHCLHATGIERLHVAAVQKLHDEPVHTVRRREPVYPMTAMWDDDVPAIR